MSILNELVEVQEAGMMDKARENAGYEPVEESAFTKMIKWSLIAYYGTLIAIQVVVVVKWQILVSKYKKAAVKYEAKNPDVIKWDDMTPYRATRNQMELMPRTKEIQSWLNAMYQQGAAGLVRYVYKDKIICYLMYYTNANNTLDQSRLYVAVDPKYKKHSNYYISGMFCMEMGMVPPKSNTFPELEELL